MRKLMPMLCCTWLLLLVLPTAYADDQGAIVGQCDGTPILQPYPLHVAYANCIGPFKWYDPIIYHDTVTSGSLNCHIYIGDISGHLRSQLVESTIIINDSIIPESIVILDSTVPCFPGQEVLLVHYNIRELILSYGWVYDTVVAPFTISGVFDDEQPFLSCGSVPLIGHTPGDLNRDGATNVADLTLLVAYLFTGGDPPPVLRAADLDRDGQVTVADLSRLVEIVMM